MRKCAKQITFSSADKLKQIDKIKTSLNPVLELLGIGSNEYLVVGSAAEALTGVSKPFNDIDVVVNEAVFKDLVRERYELSVEERGCVCNKVRVIKIGDVKIIEASTDRWLSMPTNAECHFPILSIIDLIEWRIWMGRTKDLLRAWDLVYLLEEFIPHFDIKADDSYQAVVAPHLELCKLYRKRLSDLNACD